MTKYNSENDKHRLWLAQNVISILEKWGFKIKPDDENPNFISEAYEPWEFVLERVNKWDSTQSIIVYTSIDKMSGAMRKNGKDRIRVIFRSKKSETENYYERVARINRTGEFSAIKDRLIEGIKKAQVIK
mgnify:CR=1 FL=1|tara:strand:- start:1961 stop:2350 length:390 start_codon:yes stop_codon:yes gene_type:complete